MRREEMCFPFPRRAPASASLVPIVCRPTPFIGVRSRFARYFARFVSLKDKRRFGPRRSFCAHCTLPSVAPTSDRRRFISATNQESVVREAEPLAFRVRPSVRAFAHWCGSARFARLSFARFIQRSSASVIARRSSSASDKEMPSFSSRSIYSTFFFSRTGALTMLTGARRSAAAAANTDDKISG